ncbi:hypothetical protein H257_18415 [Aphanomyces astaci]|uniref:Uncharacterized protein n=1 Tax=Aphanomyces astaci TaxID=112090 RepID=W4FBA0_APHAT|nr:hypothetical protein H257_18415 [Aphanomyces astaci]ETV64752.1 hypothetical protein H257_18415 [Aphanomyces astaci]|eukprot:XP_009845763.1 hypothetical protein H257_18415 [Aphanomyces astaci]
MLIQMGVNYEYLPTKTLNARGDNTVWINVWRQVEGPRNGHGYGGLDRQEVPLVHGVEDACFQDHVQENLTLRQGFGKQPWKDVETL